MPLSAAMPPLLATVLLLSLVAAPVLAQTAGPPASPAPTVVPPSATHAIDIEAFMPEEIEGLPTDIRVERGQEHLEGLDPDDPREAGELDDIRRFLDAVGADIEHLTTASAVAMDGQVALVVAAARVEGADEGRLMDGFLAFLSGTMADPVVEPGVLGGKDVLVLRDQGVDARGPFYLYTVDDSVWLLAVGEATAASLLEGLP